MIFCDGNLSDDDLFEQNTIIDLSRIGSSENKSLIMGLLVIRLQEYRMFENVMNSENIRHITVLEEAHNLLRKSEVGSQDEGSRISGKSVEMIANAIAEMRSYGEGFVIVDQSPSLLDMSVIRNTNTKIVLRLPDKDDRELVGRAANLNDEQICELAKLQKGVAAIYQNEWVEPVLCKVDKYDPLGKYQKTTGETISKEDSFSRRFVNSCVYDPDYLARKNDISFIDCIGKIKCEGVIKALLIDYSRIPLKDARTTWQKLAFRYFNIKECYDKFNKEQKQLEWQDLLLQQLLQYDFDKDILIVRESEAFYRFAQIMTFETITWLQSMHLDNPERILRFKNIMIEFRSKFLEH